MNKLYFLWIVFSFTNVLMAKTIVIKQKGTGSPLSRVEVKFSDQILYSNPEGSVEIPDEVNKINLHKAGYDDLIIDTSSEKIFYMYPVSYAHLTLPTILLV